MLVQLIVDLDIGILLIYLLSQMSTNSRISLQLIVDLEIGILLIYMYCFRFTTGLFGYRCCYPRDLLTLGDTASSHFLL